GINAAFLCIQSGELPRGRVWSPKRRLQFRQGSRQSISLCGGGAEPRLHTRKHQRPYRPQIDLQPELLLEPAHELGIHPCARRRPIPQRGRCSGGKAAGVPPAAQGGSPPGSPFPTTSPRRPCLLSSIASEMPTMPAP